MYRWGIGKCSIGLLDTPALVFQLPNSVNQRTPCLVLHLGCMQLRELINSQSSVLQMLHTFLLVFLVGRLESGKFLDNEIAHNDWLTRTEAELYVCTILRRFFLRLPITPKIPELLRHH